jgi:hypothetical protein
MEDIAFRGELKSYAKAVICGDDRIKTGRFD